MAEWRSRRESGAHVAAALSLAVLTPRSVAGRSFRPDAAVGSGNGVDGSRPKESGIRR